ncbi:xanthine dehydrogenase family protein molybdopterin-binding subunit [Runella slithyformis]|uniref:Isoquinoline 1-oxidoreductase n=1 Tax=Runella slithyformis (strain ATCC 29530 / DSM 19594 / LMG 11500 / NCIMB 11436 / LSU 4) TaxID=761193 RepID=A0A7U3ZHD5_RUNSL|nr:molybdopterin cofactor-binding domain-containing protein [Runella slithyformis]AEI47241.1 Isoquinoline 1-oxidoreductase [Runella slithyformis DSM 19594]
MATEDKQPKKKFSRRKFLQRGAIIFGGTVVATIAAKGHIRRFMAQKAEELDIPSVLSTYEPHFWFEVLPDNTVVYKSTKLEMGQGIFTGLAMLAAEELEVSLEQIKVVHANTANGVEDSLGTGGSNTTSSLFKPVREVAATLREMLKTEAARQWGVPITSVKVANGIMTSGTHKATYYDISVSTKEWEVPKTPALKPTAAFRFVGKDVKRIDLPPKVMGNPIFGIDQHLPDMLYAVMLQSPYIGGTLKSINAGAAAKINGVVQVIEDGELVAVVAKNRYAAEKGLQALEAVWDIPKKWQQAEFEALTTVGIGTEVRIQSEGSPESILEETPNEVFRQEYRTPLATHAHMEPHGAVAQVEKDKATLFVGTQASTVFRTAIAKAIDLKTEQVNIETTFAGGSFGRRMDAKHSEKAARIAQIVGKPVHVFNTRQQEFQNAIYRPQTHHVLAAKFTKNGSIEAITHHQATADQILGGLPSNLGYTLLGADFVSAGHGASILYNITHKSATLWQNKLPVQTGIWRSVGMLPNTFAIESFMNELAHKTGKDPIRMRMELLSGTEPINRRYQKVLETLAEKSGWNQPKAAGIGRGMAIGNDRKSIAAAVIEVMVVDNKIQVKKVTQVLDAGLAINPEGIRQQVEGATMMGITAALYEGLTVKDGQIAATNFHEYPMATLADTPEIETFIVEGHDEPYGVGEPPLAPVAPAIAAAIFDLTGKHLRTLPLKLS